MSKSTMRMPYVATTPDRAVFGDDIPLSPFDRLKNEYEVVPPELPLRLETIHEVPELEYVPEANVRGLGARWRRFHARFRAFVNDNTGLLLIAASQAFGSLMSVTVKQLSTWDPPVSPLELICVRMILTWICCVSIMSMTGVPDPVLGPKGIRMLLAFRGFCGFCGLFTTYYSLQYLSISDVTVIGFLAPMCTAVVGALVLKEDFKRSQALAGICSLVGVVLIARPAFIFGSAAKDGVQAPIGDVTTRAEGSLREITAAQRLFAVGVCLCGVLGATGAYTSIRAIGKRAHPMHNMVAFATLCIIVSSIAMPVSRMHVVVPKEPAWIALLFAVGVCGFLGQILMTMGLQRETAGRGTMAVYIQIIYATIFEKIFFNTTPPPLSILGTIIIMASAIYVAVTKNKMSAQADPTEDPALEEGLLAHPEDEDYSETTTIRGEESPIGSSGQWTPEIPSKSP
ncbi:hypothetical protein CERSUDRAFT_115894 [Gelatoporia subvermispora B]|uniref:EamA domain-containing protein n=1 Tax=Ceriporiopsis subvermispora (strain B) TaxID=914234 RepID=M2RB04_CERS8|nr:hypothetical protein CERSUDRAFT_115894 [Gelatoporia subvermispora B]